ncbi:MAG: SpoIIE family protein phosphatase [Candidatus Marinimicrobia bacterium]|nr:SpoIIE family protein phosphatase [Candidatus Neomarinimicrobiota bacterium]
MKTNHSEVQRLQAAVQELSVLNDIAVAVSSARELNDVVELIIQKCIKHLKVEQGAVLLLDQEKPDSPFRTMVREMDSKIDVVPYHFGLQLSGWMLKNQKPLLINDLQNDQRFRMAPGEDFPVQSLLSVPLRLKGRMMGLLNVFNKQSEQGFTSEDQRLLSIIAAQSAQIIENARLYEEEQMLFHMEEELKVAYEIQMNLLPKEAPHIAGYDIVGKSIPAKEVGGDYYDFISVNGHKLAICLGDVSGKGMPAALLMANLQATLRGQTLSTSSCKDCLRRSNKLLFQSTDVQKFATLFYGILDTRKNELCYTSAGHDHPFLFSGEAGPRRLGTGGIVLGFMKDVTYEEEVVPFHPGDVLVIYSDGVTEAMDAKEEEFGEKRLETLVRDNLVLSSGELMEKIISAVQSFAGDTPQYDDITLVVVKRQKMIHSNKKVPRTSQVRGT